MDDLVIRRANHRSEYVVIRNDALRDGQLSFKARGILALLLSMPDGWTVNADWIAKQGPDGRSAVLSGLRELESAKYLRRTKTRDVQGKWLNESVIYESPHQPDEPEAENRTSGNRTSKEVPTEQVLKELAAAAEKQETCSECAQGWIFDEYNVASPCLNGCPH